ncbi:MAG: RNA methyltransferase, partial [Pseudonocardiaceae bacterium]|nr:RNA methyltransferase [Pseudonocardiaceae bacterium]
MARHGVRGRTCHAGRVSPPAEPGPRSRPRPRDAFVTVYGRKPVLEALADRALTVAKVLVADGARGQSLDEILDIADARGVPVHRVSAHRVKVLAGNGRHDQGVLADVLAKRMRPLDTALPAGRTSGPAGLLVLDRITNPANVGMILRTATAAGLDGVVLPRRGTPSIDPLVVKASAGVAFHAPVLRAATAEGACRQLAEAGFAVLGLSGSAPDARSLYRDAPPQRTAYVLGNETTGLSEPVRRELTGWVSIPMAGGVESLNVASAAAVVCFEWARQQR